MPDEDRDEVRASCTPSPNVIRLVVNGVSVEVSGPHRLTYAEVVSLGHAANNVARSTGGFFVPVMTVTYSGKSRSGSLCEGQLLDLEHGMVINVMRT